MIARMCLWLAYISCRKESRMMIIVIFASEVLAGNLTIEQIPSRLRPLVQAYIDKLTTLPGEGE